MSNKTVELEYAFDSTSKTIFSLLSTPFGLSTWFADRVDAVGDNSLLFFWGKYSETADIVDTDRQSYIRYQWEKDRGSDRYFELKISKSEITQFVALQVKAIVEATEEDTELLWNNAVKKLKLSHGIR